MLIAEQSHPLVSLDARGNGCFFWKLLATHILLDELHLKMSLRGFGKVLTEAKGLCDGFGWIPDQLGGSS